MNGTVSVLISGVGGQGVLAVSRVIAAAACQSSAFVSRTESRGLSQRGGAVTSEVRFGNVPVSPAIGWRCADLILSLDALEAVRVTPFLARSGQIVANQRLAIPAYLREQWRVEQVEDEAPTQLTDSIDSIWRDLDNVLLLDPQVLADSLGFPRGANSVMLGAASLYLPIPPDELRSALAECLRAQQPVQNCRAFDLGRDTAARLSANPRCERRVVAV